MFDVFNLTFDGLDLSKLARDEAMLLATNVSVKFFYVRSTLGKPMMEIQFLGQDILVDSERCMFFGPDDIEIEVPREAYDAIWFGWYGRFKEDRIEISLDDYISYFEAIKKMDEPEDAYTFFAKKELFE